MCAALKGVNYGQRVIGLIVPNNQNDLTFLVNLVLFVAGSRIVRCGMEANNRGPPIQQRVLDCFNTTGKMRVISKYGQQVAARTGRLFGDDASLGEANYVIHVFNLKDKKTKRKSRVHA